MAGPARRRKQSHAAEPAQVEVPGHRLMRPVDRRRDHMRGGSGRHHVTVVLYGDFLCPYCRRLRPVLQRLREAMGERLAYVFRHFPNERVHPGATFMARIAEAAGRQGRFWEMYDGLYTDETPLTEDDALRIAERLGLDMARLRRDLEDPAIARRVAEDLEDGRRNKVTATPTLFVDGVRYDGAWDAYSILEAINRPVGVRVNYTARAFANLPTSAGLVLLLAAVAAIVCANGPFAAGYAALVETQLAIGPAGQPLSMSVEAWGAEGLLTIFFLIVGLEIRREMTGGSLSDPRAVVAPALAALGGVLASAGIYLALNRGGPTAVGWSIPADTGLAFVLAVLALFGRRVSSGLKVFIATFSVADDICTLAILALFYPRALHPEWLLASGALAGLMLLMNRWRVYAAWPYLGLAIVLWLTLHLTGVNAAVTGVLLAALLPTRPTPSATALLAQAATALDELEIAEKQAHGDGIEAVRIEQGPVWEWASRNLSAAAARLLSPAERIERSLEPWSTYLILPLFAFTSAGISLAADLSQPAAGNVLWGLILALAIGKPLGIVGATWAAAKARVGVAPDDATPMAFLGAACLCGIADPLAILLADRAFEGSPYAAVAKLGVLAGSLAAAALGVAILALSRPPATVMEPQPAAA